MSSRTWLKIKLRFYSPSWLVYFLLLLLVFALFLISYWLNKPRVTIRTRYKHEDPDDRMMEGEINTYMTAMTDARQAHCYKRHYDVVGKQTVSIILDYREEEFYAFKLAIHSLMKRTPAHLFNEVIVVDDCTQSEVIQRRAAVFLKQYSPDKIKQIRLDSKSGSAVARSKASKLAHGSVLVFLSVHAVVNVGWIEPLLAAVKDDFQIIAVPHFDILMPVGRFYPHHEALVNVFGWPLNTVYYESDEPASNEAIPTVVMRGDVFAINRRWYEQLGEYDEGFKIGGGQDVELSLRAWLCGGRLIKVACSRVALFEGLRQQHVTSGSNARRTAALWMEDGYQQLVYRQSGFSPILSSEEEESISLRRSFLQDNLKLKCNKLKWLLDHFKMPIIVPSLSLVQFGRIRGEKGFCLQTSPEYSVGVIPCKPFIYKREEMYEFNDQGQVVQKDRCLDSEHGRLQLTNCKPNKVEQLWRWTSFQQLSCQQDNSMCLEHVTHGDDGHYSHILELRKCKETDSQTWHFIHY